MIDAPILAYLIETANGRILYDVGCDYLKIHVPDLRARYYDAAVNNFGAPDMKDQQRIPHYLARLGLLPRRSMCFSSDTCTSTMWAGSRS